MSCEKQIVRINKLLTFHEKDLEIYRDLLKLFDTNVYLRIRFDWDGHIFTGILVNTPQATKIYKEYQGTFTDGIHYLKAIKKQSSPTRQNIVTV
jgi:hypothetical protein